MHDEDTTRRCARCKQDTALSLFSSSASYCKPCVAAYNRQRRIDKGEIVRARDRARHASLTPEKREAKREAALRWRHRNLPRHRALSRANHVLVRYGMTIDEYEQRLAGGCVICGSKNKVGMDHDHATGRVRDALCGLCNSALGYLHDDIDRARALVAYLEVHSREAAP